MDGITELYISLHCTLNIYIYNTYIYMPGCDYKWFIPEALAISPDQRAMEIRRPPLGRARQLFGSRWPWGQWMLSLTWPSICWSQVTFGTYQLITSQVQSYIKFLRGDNRQFMMASAWERGGSKLQSTWVLLVVHITWISQKSISIPGVNKVNLE